MPIQSKTKIPPSLTRGKSVSSSPTKNSRSIPIHGYHPAPPYPFGEVLSATDGITLPHCAFTEKRESEYDRKHKRNACSTSYKSESFSRDNLQNELTPFLGLLAFLSRKGYATFFPKSTTFGYNSA